MPNQFNTLLDISQSEHKVKGSKFIGVAFPMTSLTHFDTVYENLKKQHNKANHLCFAWRLDENTYRANDDGEPSGTAGRPILGQIESHGLFQVGIVVIRYFGGTLLGTSGLISAYKETAKAAINPNLIIEKVMEDLLEITFDYHKMGAVMRAIDRMQPKLINASHGDKGCIEIKVPKNKTDSFILDFKCLAGNLFPEEVNLETPLQGIILKIKT
jgi:uncharacterized YigZ family protein